MSSVREYLLQIVAVCMIAAIASSIVKNQLIGRVIRLISGILILIVVISPLSKVKISQLPDYFDSSVEVDQNAYQEAFRKQVEAATKTHVERIAQEYGFSVRAEVTASDDEVPIPESIRLYGSPNLEQMLQLSTYIESQLEIAKDRQDWRRSND